MLRNSIGEIKFFKRIDNRVPYSKSIESLSLQISTFIRIPLFINKNNIDLLDEKIKNIHEKQNIVVSFIPNEEEYNKFYSQYNKFDFFEQNRKKNVRTVLEEFDTLAQTLSSKNVEYCVFRDFESAKKYGLYDHRNKF